MRRPSVFFFRLCRSPLSLLSFPTRRSSDLQNISLVPPYLCPPCFANRNAFDLAEVVPLGTVKMKKRENASSSLKRLRGQSRRIAHFTKTRQKCVSPHF